MRPAPRAQARRGRTQREAHRCKREREIARDLYRVPDPHPVPVRRRFLGDKRAASTAAARPSLPLKLDRKRERAPQSINAALDATPHDLPRPRQQTNEPEKREHERGDARWSAPGIGRALRRCVLSPHVEARAASSAPPMIKCGIALQGEARHDQVKRSMGIRVDATGFQCIDQDGFWRGRRCATSSIFDR